MLQQSAARLVLFYYFLIDYYINWHNNARRIDAVFKKPIGPCGCVTFGFDFRQRWTPNVLTAWWWRQIDDVSNQYALPDALAIAAVLLGEKKERVYPTAHSNKVCSHHPILLARRDYILLSIRLHSTPLKIMLAEHSRATTKENWN